MDTSQGWICDTCGLPIKDSSGGSIEWLECSNGQYKGKGLRLIHNISVSPRMMEEMESEATQLFQLI